MHRMPHHSTFSQNRERRFKDADTFRKIINEIVLELLGLNGYTAIREYQSNAMKKTSATTRKKAILYVSKEKIWNSRN